MSRRYFGNAAHHVSRDSCRFHIATQIDGVLVSTIGECYPPSVQLMREIGSGRMYETMVFRVTGTCKCGCGLPLHEGSEIDSAGYNTARAATEGHEAMCQKYETAVVSV